MSLSKREKSIAILLGITVGFLAVYFLAIQPYFDSLAQTRKDYDAASLQWNEHTSLADRRVALTKIWKDIQDGGLSSDQSLAEGQAYTAVSDWANASNVLITSLKSDRNTDAAPFQIIGFHVTANGTTPTIARFLKSFESATIPVRVDDIQITPRREGTDELIIQMSVSTLCLKPEATKPDKTVAQLSEDRSWN